MRRAVAIAVVSSAVLVGCPSVPDHANAWLSYKYRTPDHPVCETDGDALTQDCRGLISDDTAAWAYYRNLGIEDPDTYTYEQWAAENALPASVETHAVYANLADLQFGRDMKCASSGTRIACAVANYGPAPSVLSSWPDVTRALEEALNFGVSFGTVAMVYDAGKAEPNQVSFYAFGEKKEFTDDGDVIIHPNALLYTVALDTEGPKNVPRMCMACHGGTYDEASNSATGGKFLPFDVFSFRFPSEPGWSFEEQQVALRKLNELVVATNPGAPIVELVDGLYQGDVHAEGPAVDGYVPAGWLGNANLYRSVVRPYCRTCHVAQPDPVVFRSLAEFENVVDRIKTAVCDKKDMPHAQVPFGLDGKKIGFWNDRVAQQDLGNFFKEQLGESCLPSD